MSSVDDKASNDVIEDAERCPSHDKHQYREDDGNPSRTDDENSSQSVVDTDSVKDS
jgi:hypothetical protein